MNVARTTAIAAVIIVVMGLAGPARAQDTSSSDGKGLFDLTQIKVFQILPNEVPGLV